MALFPISSQHRAPSGIQTGAQRPDTFDLLGMLRQIRVFQRVFRQVIEFQRFVLDFREDEFPVAGPV